jgi:magnesium-transporting ATPase (P-type)
MVSPARRLPKALCLFSRPSFAAYFLIVCILQSFPEISITAGIPTAAIPLTAVLAFDGLLTAIEDWKRHAADERVNSRMVTKLAQGKWVEVQSRDILVGDILRLRSAEAVPADCVLLCSKHESEDEDPAVCFVKTDQLDGESNLKLKRTVKEVAKQLSNPSRLAMFQGLIECGPPDPDFHQFRGNIILPVPPDAAFMTDSGSTPAAAAGPPGGAVTVSGASGEARGAGLPSGFVASQVPKDVAVLAQRLAKRSDGGSESSERFSVDANALLLRGMEVRGIEYAVTMVVYTGNQCKIRVKAAKKPRPKTPLMERQVNRFLVGIIIAQILLCLLGALIDQIFLNTVAPVSWYLNHGAKSAQATPRDFVLRSLTFFLLTAQFIPVSLYVSIRATRQFQQLVMQLDRAMAYRLEGTAAAAAIADREARAAAAATAPGELSVPMTPASGASSPRQSVMDGLAPSSAAAAAMASGDGKAVVAKRALAISIPATGGAVPPSPLSATHPDAVEAVRRQSIKWRQQHQQVGYHPPRSSHGKGDIPAPLDMAPSARAHVSVDDVQGMELAPMTIRAPADGEVDAGGMRLRSANTFVSPSVPPTPSRSLLTESERAAANDDIGAKSPGNGFTANRTVSGTRRMDAAADPHDVDHRGMHVKENPVSMSMGRPVPRSASARTALSTQRLPARGTCCGACGQGGSFECCAPGPEARVLGGQGWCGHAVYDLFDAVGNPEGLEGSARGDVARAEAPPVIWPNVRTMELNDELGQVTHIFSDKTGTLTRNSFEFRKISVAGVEYGRGSTTIGLARLRRAASSSPDLESMVSFAQQQLEEGEKAVRPLPHVNFLDGIPASVVPTKAGLVPRRTLAGDLGVTWQVGTGYSPPDVSAVAMERRAPGAAPGRGGTPESVFGGIAPPPALAQAWLAAASLVHGGATHAVPCPGGGGWGHTHVGLGPIAGMGVERSAASLKADASMRLAEFGSSSSSHGAPSSGRSHSAGGVAPLSKTPLEHVVRDQGRSPVHTLPTEARQALSAELRHFFLNLALNHSVELEMRKNKQGVLSSVGLSASSPDEEAFVAMAALAGWEFAGRSRGVIKLLLPDGHTRPFRVVTELPYTQERRMMSVVVEFPDAGDADDSSWVTHGIGRGKYALFSKGADSRIAELSSGYEDARGIASACGVPDTALSHPAEVSAAAHNATMAPSTMDHMNTWAADGLRTLLFAWRPLSRDWVEKDCGVGTFAEWKSRCRVSAGGGPSSAGAGDSGVLGWLPLYTRATQDLDERERKERGLPNAIDHAMGVIERALRQQGATGIEDRLQAGVPEAVAALRDGGIKVYMLTGDKRATAVNIGFAVQLLTDEHVLVTLTKDKLVEDSEEIRSAASAAEACKRLGRYGTAIASPPASDSAKDMERWLLAVVQDQLVTLEHLFAKGASDQPLALVLDDPVLAAMLGEKGVDGTTVRDMNAKIREVRALSRRVMEMAESVVCCRCSPSHKKAVVALIKYGPTGAGTTPDPSVTTLAVGDGANDVEMIMEASVGVGVQGAEGAQAANSADYSFGQFRFLQRLLLVHGRWNYRRMAYLILYSLYKNFQFTLVTYFLQIYMGFSGQKVIVEMAIQTFNLVYTSFPIIWAAVLDQDIDQDTAQRFPYAYTEGRRREHMMCWRFIAWATAGVYEGAVIAFGLVWWFGRAGAPGPLSMPDIFTLGQVAFSAMILLLSVQVAVGTHLHHWSYQVLLAVSALLWGPAFFVFDQLNADNTRGAFRLMVFSPSLWLFLAVILAIALIPTCVSRISNRQFTPSFPRIAFEAQQLFRRGAHDSTYYIDKYDIDGDDWVDSQGFEARSSTCQSCRSGPNPAHWSSVEMQFRKFPFFQRIEHARMRAEATGLDPKRAEALMAERVDRVFVGRGWPTGTAADESSVASPLRRVAVGTS